MIARSITLLALAATLAACAGDKPLTYKQAQTASTANCLLGPFVRNADGSLTWAQLQDGVNAAFDAADLDGDGFLTSGEIARVNDARTGTCDSSSLIDWSGTGKIDRKTFAARYETNFGFADRERDGIVTAVEMANPPATNSNERRPKPVQQPNDPTQMPGGIPNVTGQQGGAY